MAISVVTDLRNTQTTTDLSWTTPSLAIGDIVVVTIYSEDATFNPFAAPTATGITFVQRVRDTTASHCFVAIYTGIATATGVTTITSVNTSSTNSVHSGVAYIFPTADGYSLAVTPNTVDTRGTGAPSGTQTGVSGSICVGINGDWAAVNPSTRAYRGTVTQDGTSFLAGDSTGYFWHQTLATTSTTIGLTAPTGQTYTIAAIEVLFVGGAFTGSATATATLTATAAGVVGKVGDATTALALTATAAGVVGKVGDATTALALTATVTGATQRSGDAATALTLTGAAAGVVGASSGATTALTLGATAAGVVGTSSGATTTLNLAATATGQGSQPSSGATTALTLGATAAGVVGKVGDVTATLSLTGVAAGVAAPPGGNAQTTLTLTGAAAGVVAKSSDAAATLALGAAAAGVVGLFGDASTALILTGMASAPLPGGDATIELDLTATADGFVSSAGTTIFAPDRPDWTREDTASIIYAQTKILGPDVAEIFGLSGVGSYTLLAQSAGAGVPIFLVLSYDATPDLSTPVAVSIATCAASPLAAQSMAYESPSYGGSLGVFNHDPVNPITVTVYSSNRVVATPRYIGDLLPGRSYRLATVFVAGAQLFVPPADYQTFGYCANVDTGFCATSTDAGVLYYAYLDGVSAPQQVPIMTLAAGVTQLAQLPLPQSMGQFYFTPATPNAAGVLTLLAYPARS